MDLSIGGFKIRMELLIAAILLYFVLWGHALCGCARVGLFEGFDLVKNKVKKEGFSSMFSPDYGSVPLKPANTANWTLPNQNRPIPATSEPLDKDEMVFFAKTEFKPECCPNAYSTSSGCACMSDSQYKFLKERGGNNVPLGDF